MGYRSDVILGLEKKVYDRVKDSKIEVETSEWTDTGVVTGKKDVLLLEGFEVQKETDDLVILRIDEVKWYPGYKDVDAIIDLVGIENDKHENDEPNFLVVLGEEGECGNNNHGDWYEHIYYSAEIGLY